MNYFLIDFENVKLDGVKDLKGVQEGDAIIFFYSEQCKNVTLDLVQDMLTLKLQYNSYKVKVGTKNALDFQLSSHLGFLIGQLGSDANYYIVSNDKGYDCLCSHWVEQGISVERVLLKEEKKTSAKTSKTTTTSTKTKSKVKASDIATIEEIQKLLAKEDEPEVILQIFNQYKTKQAICNGISKKFKDSKRTSAVYKKLKPLLKEKNKS